MFIKFALVFALALFGSAAAQVFVNQCPSNICVVSNFNIPQYMGVWYEYAKYPTFFESNSTCVQAQYALLPSGIVSVQNSAINASNGQPSGINGTATPVENGKLLVQFPTVPQQSVSSNYWVLNTDYTSYSVVYSCAPVSSSMNTITVWILSRARNPPAAVIQQAESVITQNNLSTSSLVITNQSNCQSC